MKSIIILFLSCFLIKGEETSDKYNRYLNAICSDIYDNDIQAKKTISEGAFLVTDPIEGTSRVEFKEPINEQIKKFKNTFNVEKQVEIFRAYEWPIFPLRDTLYIYDKTGLFKANKFSISKSENAKKTFVISHTKPDSSKNAFVLDTLISRETNTFVCFSITNDTNSIYYFRFSNKEINDVNSKLSLQKGIMNRW